MRSWPVRHRSSFLRAERPTAGIHLRDLYSGIFEESAVNADLTEFIFDKNELFAVITLLDKLLDKRGFACSEEA